MRIVQYTVAPICLELIYKSTLRRVCESVQKERKEITKAKDKKIVDGAFPSFGAKAQSRSVGVGMMWNHVQATCRH
jgi:hypothetical protein